MWPACLWPIFPYMQKFWKMDPPVGTTKPNPKLLMGWGICGFGVKNNQFIPRLYSIKGSTWSLVHEMRPGRTDRHPLTSTSWARRSLGSTGTIAKAAAAAIAQTQKFRSYRIQLHKPKTALRQRNKPYVCMYTDNGRNVFIEPLLGGCKIIVQQGFNSSSLVTL